jgi:riboflavin synthase
VIEINHNILKVGIIPVTWEKTMLKHIEVGDHINIEADVIAKYVEKLIQQ